MMTKTKDGCCGKGNMQKSLSPHAMMQDGCDPSNKTQTRCTRTYTRVNREICEVEKKYLHTDGNADLEPIHTYPHHPGKLVIYKRSFLRRSFLVLRISFLYFFFLILSFLMRRTLRACIVRP